MNEEKKNILRLDLRQIPQLDIKNTTSNRLAKKQTVLVLDDFLQNINLDTIRDLFKEAMEKINSIGAKKSGKRRFI